MKKHTTTIMRLFVIFFLTNNTMAMEENNRSAPLLSLPSELFKPILSAPIFLKDSVKSSLQLRKTCKEMNALLSTELIGTSVRHYNQITKDISLSQLIKYLNKETYLRYKNAAMILIHSGADDNKNERHVYPTLLERVSTSDDIDAVKILFNNGAKPDQRNLLCPVFFTITSRVVAQEFINRGFDIHKPHWAMQNVLWYTIAHNHPYSLVQFYLELGVNPTILDSASGTCIAHYFADFVYKSFEYTNATEFDNYIKICRLLLNAAPEMLNIHDKDKKTPLDQANDYLVKEGKDNIKKLIQTIINLFKEYQDQ